MLSIRWATHDQGACACGRPTGHGPVGFEDDRPLCDPCLLARCEGLGRMLVMVDLVRALTSRSDNELDGRLRAVTLVAAGRVYDEGAGWPRRSSGAAELLEEFASGTVFIVPDFLSVH